MGHRGPGAPANGPYHHYVFELFALDTKLEVQPTADAFETPANAHYTDLLIKAQPREGVPLPAFPDVRGKVTTIDNTRGVQMKLGAGKRTQVGFERHPSSNITRGIPAAGKRGRGARGYVNVKGKRGRKGS